MNSIPSSAASTSSSSSPRPPYAFTSSCIWVMMFCSFIKRSVHHQYAGFSGFDVYSIVSVQTFLHVIQLNISNGNWCNAIYRRKYVIISGNVIWKFLRKKETWNNRLFFSWLALIFWLLEYKNRLDIFNVY